MITTATSLPLAFTWSSRSRPDGPGMRMSRKATSNSPARERGERLVAARGLDHLVAGLLEGLAQHEADARLVVGHQHAGTLAHGSLRTGSAIRTRVPTPFSLSRWRLPRWRATQ